MIVVIAIMSTAIVAECCCGRHFKRLQRRACLQLAVMPCPMCSRPTAHNIKVLTLERRAVHLAVVLGFGGHAILQPEKGKAAADASECYCFAC